MGTRSRWVADAAFNVHEAKTHFSRLLQRVVDGDDIVIAKAGKPIARLVPFDATLALDRKLGALENKRRAELRCDYKRETDLYAAIATGGVPEDTQEWAESWESAECLDGD
jgi:prevent-host-death family protein